MTTQNTTRRLRPQLISEDVTSWHGLQTINTYETNRAEASAAKLQQAYQAMLAQQQAETEKQTLYRAAADAARLAEWEFHNTVLAMKEVVRGQYGLDSDQAQAVGLKKKSEYKRPSRKKSVTSLAK
ncbi:MAG: hypothetical protein RMZ41_005955 [Nostoc sp. DedVER02]|uniref:hypothetical protein n=1 Tax=unclassified Nostoc TaxID=2593658 RepID=UPI002AD57735|nr:MULTISPECIES: hypothetical protein [unclassified Nostoc]MDZ7973343.1 hypothetical protein [Nostoc sp. DedQUE03]MDZ7985806.1 hypothetical protein [Nostoc sp. DedVER02]MDZ8045384.1 hypothetical protein [Nostoc sp. DedQUE02]MDZ8114641.1 hypothetical protein [Nostoc sp. DedVER01b]